MAETHGISWRAMGGYMMLQKVMEGSYNSKKRSEKVMEHDGN
jgi:hypothetical protein